MHPLISGILIMATIGGIAYCICLAYWDGYFRSWFDWLNPWDYSKGLVDGKTKRAEETQRSYRAAQDAEHIANMERIAEKDRLVQTQPRRIPRLALEGIISGHASPPDAEFIRRYGSPKTMTLETLERLMEVRKAARERQDENSQ